MTATNRLNWRAFFARAAALAPAVLGQSSRVQEQPSFTVWKDTSNHLANIDGSRTWPSCEWLRSPAAWLMRCFPKMP